MIAELLANTNRLTYLQEYWSLLDGDEYGSWVDARLTDLGISQAQTAHATWEQQIKKGIPSPESYYVSPLNRCCQTAQVTFEGLRMPGTEPFRPLIKEVRIPPPRLNLHHSNNAD